MPVIFLAARDTASDTVTGLALGGDDYITKPFSMEALVARVRAMLLAYLMRNHGLMLTRRQILENVWGWEYGVYTQRGVGYSLRPPGHASA
ncbi:MAG: response regulator receiver [Actinomycetia bacterium]|nr:response regulator receiver [Actinomycetes bacterium]